VFTSAFAHYILIRLQKSKKEIKRRKKRSPTLDLSTLDLHHLLLLFSSLAIKDNKGTICYSENVGLTHGSTILFGIHFYREPGTWFWT
jgi:hypothetical protein